MYVFSSNVPLFEVGESVAQRSCPVSSPTSLKIHSFFSAIAEKNGIASRGLRADLSQGQERKAQKQTKVLKKKLSRLFSFFKILWCGLDHGMVAVEPSASHHVPCYLTAD